MPIARARAAGVVQMIVAVRALQAVQASGSHCAGGFHGGSIHHAHELDDAALGAGDARRLTRVVAG